MLPLRAPSWLSGDQGAAVGLAGGGQGGGSAELGEAAGAGFQAGHGAPEVLRRQHLVVVKEFASGAGAVQGCQDVLHHIARWGMHLPLEQVDARPSGHVGALNALPFPADEGGLHAAVVCARGPASVRQLPAGPGPRLPRAQPGRLLGVVQAEYHISSQDVEVPGDD